MSKNSSKYLRLLIAFSVAITAIQVRAQIEASPQNPGRSPQGTTSACANGRSSCPWTPSTTQTQQGLPGSDGTSSRAFPRACADARRAPAAVYRNDADGTDHHSESFHPANPVKPQPVNKFQMLVAGSSGCVAPIYGADPFGERSDSRKSVRASLPGAERSYGSVNCRWCDGAKWST